MKVNYILKGRISAIKSLCDIFCNTKSEIPIPFHFH